MYIIEKDNCKPATDGRHSPWEYLSDTGSIFVCVRGFPHLIWIDLAIDIGKGSVLASEFERPTLEKA
jgi:hypothetical protein